MVEGERERHDAPGLPFIARIGPDGLSLRASESQDRGVGVMDDRGEMACADSAQVGDCEAAAAEVFEAQVAAAGPLRSTGQLDCDLDDVLLGDVADHWHDEAARRVDGYAQMHVALEDELVGFCIEAAIDVWVSLERYGHDLEHDCGDREPAAGVFGS